MIQIFDVCFKSVFVNRKSCVAYFGQSIGDMIAQQDDLVIKSFIVINIPKAVWVEACDVVQSLVVENFDLVQGFLLAGFYIKNKKEILLILILRFLEDEKEVFGVFID